jgi:Gram-negative bacterial TonB protein C-terminal
MKKPVNTAIFRLLVYALGFLPLGTPSNVQVASAQESSARPLRASVGADVPRAISQEPPVYPQSAIDERVEGKVVLHVIIGGDGRVKEATVMSGPAILAAPCVEAVKTWTYDPVRLNAAPIELDTTVTLNFLLGPPATVSINNKSPNAHPTISPEGSFAKNTYRNDFFGFSYTLPGEWHKSSVTPGALPSGAYYLFIGDRDTGQPLLNRVTVVADPKSENQPGASTQEYLSAYIRAQVRNANAKVVRQPSSFVAGENNFYRADYKWVHNGTTVYSSMVCIERNNYWLSWSFAAPSQRDFDDAMNTVQNISFDRSTSR